MTRILHTADLHLTEDHPERWTALEAVLAAVRDHAVDALLVAGDLLDSAADHAALRTRVRAAFGSIDVPVLLLPGNHDRTAYRPGQDWGPRTTLLLGTPTQEATVGALHIVAVPFPEREIGFAQVRREVEARLGAPMDNAGAAAQGASGHRKLLVLHGTLIDGAAPQIQDDSRAQESGPYFPIRTEDLASLPVDYVALGHYHQHADRRVGGARVAYAGSPSPIGPRALGPRSALLVEISSDGTEIRPVELPVPWRARLERWITPFEEREGLEALAAELEEVADPRCHVRVRLDGILAEMSEVELRSAVDELRQRLSSSFGSLELEIESVGLDPARADLFRDFRRRLETRFEAEPMAADLPPGAPPERVARRALELAARALKA